MYFITMVILVVVILFVIFAGIKLYNIKLNNTNNISIYKAQESRTDINEAKEIMRQIAAEHSYTTSKNGWTKILNNVEQSWQSLKKINEYLLNVPDKMINLVPSAQWLLDNHYIIEREVKTFKQNAKKGLRKRLPVVEKGELKGYPRIYLISKQLLRCTGYHLQEEQIISILNAYQSVSPLTVDELWSFFDILKASIIEDLNILASDIIKSIKTKQKANKLMDEILENNKFNSNNLVKFLEERFLSKSLATNSAFISQILFRLKESAIDDDFLTQWLSKDIEKKFNLSNIISEEGQYQSRLQVSAGLLISSLKEESVLDFEKIFERISHIEKVLSEDPINAYSKMDFDTRVNYHQKIKIIAEKLNTQELKVAQESINISLENYEKNGEQKLSHVGYYLVGKGQEHLYRRLAYKPNIFSRIVNYYIFKTSVLYFVGIALITLLICSLSILYTMRRLPNHGLGLLTLVLLVVFIPAMTIAVEIVNSLCSRLIKPKKLPSLDFEDGIPDEYRSMVVIPVVFSSIEQVKSYLQRLETYYLANLDKNLYFALLGDYKDGSSKNMPDDSEILHIAVEEIKDLNQKYPGDQFCLFHRNRAWNKKQESWMGWERKRGILEEFNALILGEDRKSFSTIIVKEDILNTIKYVITIDAGTELIRDSAKKLIGMMAHPLNTPVMNEEETLVTDGYTIIQPRIGIRIAAALSTNFTKIFAGQAGIDTYAMVVSDIYQDVFDKGIFGGKGIYDPRVFHKVLSKAIPENSIVCHDLLECCYVQCAFASNVELMDDFPSNIASFFTREHRWIRGDWQLLPWIFSNNPLSGLSKYKIADNLRRSLIPVSHILLIILAMTLFSWEAYVWLTIVLFTTLFPLLIHVSKTTLSVINNYGIKFNIINHFRNIVLTFIQGFIWFIILPYRAYISADAIFRTLYRLLISKKKMLEWKTAEAAERSLSNNLKSYIRRMWVCPITGIILVAITKKELWVYSISLAILWGIAPLISYVISIPLNKNKINLSKSDMQDLRIIARKTWRYFDEFFTEYDNWLIPDNYQVWPENGVAHRTSTTNIGLQLLCILSARDFGYISIFNLVDRLEKVFATLSKLEKWKGHFYNWYDTKTLQPLAPMYVSTVDSGNFLGCLISLKNGLTELKSKPILNSSILKGLIDMLELSNIKIEFNEPVNNEEWINLLQTLKVVAGESKNDNEWKMTLINVCNDFLEEIHNLNINDYEQTATLEILVSTDNLSAQRIIQRIDNLIKIIREIVIDTDFKPLYDKKHNIFRIGYNVSLGIPDNSYYDLLASEARLASFIAIAKGDVPQKHWFKLGRTLTFVKGYPTLVSWSGTMFEYLMPNLFMRMIPNTMLYQTSVGAVERQIEYGKVKNTPWGMSEAAYYRFDQHLNYQYRAIGVPGLGFSNDLGKYLVIAPYATILALSVNSKVSHKNIRLMRDMGAEGDYGYYEAIDYITPKTNSYKKYNIVKSFFAHHQGMSLTALNNFINDNIIQERFHKEPIIKATEIIMEEKQPSFIIIRDEQKDIAKSDSLKRSKKHTVQRIVDFIKPIYPIAHVLSNNSYTVMLTSDGSGMSWNGNTVINRWRSDYTCDSYGTFFYIRDIDTKKYWSTFFKPVGTEPDSYEVVFSLDKAEYKRKDNNIDTKTEVIVSPQDNVEIRRITICNNQNKQINIEVTSYFEVVIDKYNNDLAHPAFNKLFVETEYLQEKQTLLATRRQRGDGRDPKWLFHTVLVGGKTTDSIEYETDRSKFIGQGKTLRNPDAMVNGIHLSNTVGKVLDPIMSIRIRLTISPGKSKTITYITGITKTREEAVRLTSEYRKPNIADDAFKLALFNSELEMQYLDITPQQANAVQDMIGSIYYPSLLMRAPVETILNNTKSQPYLWRFGISGDYPIILLRLKDDSEIEAVKDIIIAYEYLRMKGVKVDLVVLNEVEEGYYQDFNRKISDLLSNVKIFDVSPSSPGTFLLQASSMHPEEIILILTVARVVLSGTNRLLSRKIRSQMFQRPPEVQSPYKYNTGFGYQYTELAEEELFFYNGIGGFTKDGKEYVVLLKDNQTTPAPWINVITNKFFGFHVSTTGSGYTWSINSRENKLTDWTNDPVIDQPSEVIYIRDEATGKFFTPTASPIRELTPYKVTHGFGYSVFEHNSIGLEQKTTVFTTSNDPVKIYKVNIRNNERYERNLSLMFYAELVLGVTKEHSSPFITSSFDSTLDALILENRYSSDYQHNKTFVFSSEKIISYSTDRVDFIGKGGCLDEPKALLHKELPNRIGAGFDPCSAIKVNINLPPSEEKEIVFILGQSANSENIAELITKYRSVRICDNELHSIKENWSDTLGKIKVSTSDNSFNYMMNGWLLYQVISCRLLARSAFYQSSGAYGFRDQLQDSMSLLHAAPDMTRETIIRHSSRQYVEGDVQHWWHHDTGRGVRTRVSDDFLWLPYVTSEYIKNTGDVGILNEKAGFLEDKELEPDEHDRFSTPKISQSEGTIYEHCIKAIERALNFGCHGLPLIGTGDWNDGMNKIGYKGKGESVWLAWFLYSVLNKFIPICKLKEDYEKAEHYQKVKSALIDNVESNAWDGEWYIRAYYDDGTLLGSRQNVECQIDSISQSWSVISEAADVDRANLAIDSVRKYLVKDEDQLILLLTPPFDKVQQDPGYIKAYIPGIRENGGQYTHAAVWNVIAFAMLRKGDIAYDLFKMLNPVSHAINYSQALKYKNEPYVMSADVYSTHPYNGRGGWSWYTGAAGWMYQAGISWILGIKKNGDKLIIDPTIPKEWKEYSIEYTYKNTRYIIKVENPHLVNYGVYSMRLDGSTISGNEINLIDDGKEHVVEVTLGIE